MSFGSAARLQSCSFVQVAIDTSLKSSHSDSLAISLLPISIFYQQNIISSYYKQTNNFVNLCTHFQDNFFGLIVCSTFVYLYFHENVFIHSSKMCFQYKPELESHV